ncbi:Protein KTI12-like protein, partial [Ophiophagus hannah]
RDVVIVDAGSELKSFRYELYCLSKHAGTPHCLVLCPGGGALPDRPPLEPPDSQNRWDWPLFLAPEDPAEPLPLPEIRAALLERRPPPPNQSTRSQPLQAAGFLHQLDRLTQEVLAARDGAQAGQFIPVAVDGLAGGGREPPGLLLNRPVSLAELSRLRRQFLSYAKMHPGEGEQNLPQLGGMFLQYLIAVAGPALCMEDGLGQDASGVKLVARRQDALCAGHTHPSFTNWKNVKCHVMTM